MAALSSALTTTGQGSFQGEPRGGGCHSPHFSAPPREVFGYQGPRCYQGGSHPLEVTVRMQQTVPALWQARYWVGTVCALGVT